MRSHFDFEKAVGDTEDGRNIFMHVVGSMTEYRPATMYNRFGDPGDPAEGGEIEVETIEFYDDDGNDVEFDMDPAVVDEICAEYVSENERD